MQARPFVPETLVDGVFAFEAGVNEGIGVLLLEKNQLARAVNITVRGDFINPRPPFVQRTLDFQGDTSASSIFQTGLFQGACYYFGDDGSASLMVALSGRLFQILLGDVTATVTEITITGGPNPADRTQAWLWQAEKWVFWNDGLSTCIFWTPGAPAFRSNNTGVATLFNTTTNDPAFSILPVGTQANAVMTSGLNMVVGDVLTVQNFGLFQVMDISMAPTMVLLNLTGSPVGTSVPTGTAVTWQHRSGNQLPPGRMGAYGRGRNVVSLVDGKQFVYGDIEGGSSGTPANNFRDAILYITENSFLTGGGNFSVPGNVGEITAMVFAIQLDASLGQGPLQIFTEEIVFSCAVPTDRTTWQNMTSPILTESLINVGAQAQGSTINVNSDILYRSSRGISSFILGRREISSVWGNTPISFEVDPILRQDSPTALRFGSAVTHDNRFIITVKPTPSDRGIFHKGLVVINLDPVSTLRGKQPSVYDGLWIGINPVWILTGRVNKSKRCFALTLNSDEKPLELWEALSTGDTPIYDTPESGQGIPIIQEVDFPLFDFQEKEPQVRRLKRLLDGEIYLDEVRGKVQLEMYWKPDQWPCFEPWHKWEICSGAVDPQSGKPSFQPRMGLGEPSPDPCDKNTNRPLREGYVFQCRLLIRGHCRFIGMRVKAVTLPESTFAAPICSPIC